MNYSENGFLKISNLLTDKELRELKSYIKTLNPKLYLPNGNAPWGYGNLIEDIKLKFIVQKDVLTQYITSILDDNFIFNHLLINNKSKWIGPPVEWHQESSLIDTFAPGYPVEDSHKFLQIYIAIDDHTIENGCLIVSPGSHKLGLLSHDDIIGYNFNHKKQLKQEVLDKLNITNPFKNIPLKAGDCLLFSHLLVHGSGSNNTASDRRSIIIQARVTDRQLDSKKFEQYSLFRTNFALNFFQKRISKLTNTNIYKDFFKNGKKSIK